MDRLLAELPSPPVPPDLAGKVRQAVQARARRLERLRLGLSTVLATAGVWLALPGLAFRLERLELPDSGLPLLLQVLNILLAGLGGWLTELTAGLLSFQASYVRSLEPSTWLGLMALGFACLLALDLLLPRFEG